MNSENWKKILSQSVTTVEALPDLHQSDREDINEVIKTYPFKINTYYLSLIKEKGDPVWKQAVPDKREITGHSLIHDPLCEGAQSPEINLISRYPDRVILLVTHECSMYCRFCMRKRKVGKRKAVTENELSKGIDYIARNKNIKDVILSGGDPLMLEDIKLKRILTEIRKIKHVETIRIHSRAICTLPARITEPLCRMLSRFHPIYINTHINHPREITRQVTHAADLINTWGIPLGCQTVLLKGVNNTQDILKRLFRKLVKNRIRPYYLHHPDLVRGTGHFRCSIKDGLAIMKSLRGHISGMCIPHYVLDLPGGGGKVPLTPEYIREIKDNELIVESFNGKLYRYPC